jgi:peptide/nickel transport system permease protein
MQSAGNTRPVPPPAKTETSIPGLARSNRSRAWVRFRRHKLALAATAMLSFLVVVTALAPWTSPMNPIKTDILHATEAPSTTHWLGTDTVGRDVLSRLIYAGRVSLSVGVLAALVATTIGVILGAISGFYRGVVDNLIMRITEAVMSYPSLVLIITAVALLGPSIYNVVIVLGLLGWPGTCRLVRGQFFSLREQDFVLAARTIGSGSSRIIFKHMLPNAISPVIVAATFQVAGAILTETSLSFLGMGVQAPTPSWGNMLNAAQGLAYLEHMGWLWLPPGLMISVSVLCINFMGDALRDALDPRATR